MCIMWYKFKAALFGILALCLFSAIGCKKKSSAQTAYYYWKTGLQLNKAQQALLQNTASNRLYLRFFDLVWNEQRKEVIPNAMVSVNMPLQDFRICPVIYITNKAFEHTQPEAAEQLALKVSQLIEKMAVKYGISYQQVQMDCDWTVATKESYFSFLKAFKKHSKKQLEATIRLHQVKYPERTGVPPVDKGLLMFYNMGKLSGDPHAPNSIYNAADAEKYVAALGHYFLPLDIALPVFSWSLQIRNGRLMQIYGKIDRTQLDVNANFERLDNGTVYRARRSFYLEGIYVKDGDLFKLEDMDRERLEEAANQASKYLTPLENRNIIYYELSSVNLSLLKEEDIKEVSARF